MDSEFRPNRLNDAICFGCIILTVSIATNSLFATAQTSTSPVCRPPSDPPPPGMDPLNYVCYYCNISSSADLLSVPGNASLLVLQFTAGHTVNLSGRAALPANIGGPRLTSLTVYVDNFPLSSLSPVGNGERVVAPGLFANLPQLDELSLFTAVDQRTTPFSLRLLDGSFDGLARLRTLQMARLGIGDDQLPVGAFRGLESIANLDLNQNRIRRIARGTFATQWTAAVRNGSGTMSSDAVKPAASTVFKRCCPHLTTLNLALNNISDISDVSLYGLTALRVIDLHGNHIAYIGKASFAVVHDTIVEMNLAKNQITRLDSRSFAGLQLLRSLFLEHNAIVSIGSLTFVGLPKLRTLLLSSNSIGDIPSGTFGAMTTPRLRILSLSSNVISRIDEQAFHGLSDLRQLDLSGNRLTALPTDLLDDAVNSPVVRLKQNEWYCDCRLYQVLRLATIPDDDAAFCQMPADFQGMQLPAALANISNNCCVPTSSISITTEVATYVGSFSFDVNTVAAAASDAAGDSRSLNVKVAVASSCIVSVIILITVVAVLIGCRLCKWGIWKKKRSVNIVVGGRETTDARHRRGSTAITCCHPSVINECPLPTVFITDVNTADYSSSVLPMQHLSAGYVNEAANFSDELSVPCVPWKWHNRCRMLESNSGGLGRQDGERNKTAPEPAGPRLTGRADIGGLILSTWTTTDSAVGYSRSPPTLRFGISGKHPNEVDDNIYNAQIDVALNATDYRGMVCNNSRTGRGERESEVDNRHNIDRSYVTTVVPDRQLTTSHRYAHEIDRVQILLPPVSPPPRWTTGMDDFDQPPPPYSE